MKSLTCLVSFLVVSLAGTGCDVAETSSPAVAPSEAVLEPRVLGIWRNVSNDELGEEEDAYSELEEGVLIRVSAFDDRQMLLEMGGPSECGLDCSVEPCREMTDCADPIQVAFSAVLARLLVTEVAGATWVSMHPFAPDAEYAGWYTGRITFRAGDTLLVEMLDDDGAEQATTPETVRALLTEENLSGGERYLLVPVPVEKETSPSPPAG